VVGEFRPGSGALDVAVLGQVFNQSGTVSVLAGNGDGTFQSPVTYGAGPNTTELLAGDFNGDGVPDLVTVNHGDPADPVGSVRVLLGNGDGSFRPPRSLDTGQGSPIQPALLGDFNGDGKLDILASGLTIYPEAEHVNLLPGNGDGTFQGAVNYFVGFNGNQPTSLAVGNFTGNGPLDLAVTNWDAGSVSVLLNQGQAPAPGVVGACPRGRRRPHAGAGGGDRPHGSPKRRRDGGRRPERRARGRRSGRVRAHLDRAGGSRGRPGRGLVRADEPPPRHPGRPGPGLRAGLRGWLAVAAGVR
jgi:hypothetical protein